MNKKITTDEMELALARYFDPRQQLVVPNVSWGFGIHECDLLVLTKSGYASEVEIKISKADLVKDLKKEHGHNSKYIKFLYFAIPDYLKECMDKIPEKAGILVISRNPYKESDLLGYIHHNSFSVFLERKPQLWCGTWGGLKCKSQKLTVEEQFKVARLGALRIWDLKEKIVSDKDKICNIHGRCEFFTVKGGDKSEKISKKDE